MDGIMPGTGGEPRRRGRRVSSRSAARAIAGALVATAVALVARGVARDLETFRAPQHSPRAFLRHGRPPGTRTLVVCAGDSITHGAMSADYLELLRARLGRDGYAFVNAGINGNLAWNVLGRLDDVIACRPDAVTLLVGSNDVLATLGPAWARTYRRQQGIRETPTITWYRENVAAILARLRAGTDARVAVLELPPLGEDLESEINDVVRAYNAALHEVAAAAGVPVLPLHGRLVALIPDGRRTPAFAGRRDLMGSALVRRLVLRRSWDRIAADHGLLLLTDFVHLDDRAAAVVAALVAEWLTGPEVPVTAPA